MIHLKNFDIRLFLLLNKLSGRTRAGNFAITILGEYFPYALVFIAVLSLFLSESIAREPLAVIISTLAGALISRFIFGTPLRYFLKRARPFKVHRVYNVLTEESFSFPSGHSLFFFGFSTVIFCFNHMLGIFFFASTCIITLFRIIAGVHYPADIAAGMLIGIFSGFATFIFLTPLIRIFLYS